MHPLGAGRRAARVRHRDAPGNAEPQSLGSSTSTKTEFTRVRSGNGEELQAYHRENLDLILRPRRELAQGEFLPLTFDREARAVRRGGGHPHVRVGRVADPSADREALQLAGEQVEHGLARDERGRAERDGQLVARAVVVAAGLPRALGHADSVERRHLGWGELIQRGVDVPAVEARHASCLVLRRDDRLVEGRMRGVLKRGGLEALVIVYDAVADELHLRYAGDRLEVRMQDGFFRGLGLIISVPI